MKFRLAGTALQGPVGAFSYDLDEDYKLGDSRGRDIVTNVSNGTALVNETAFEYIIRHERHQLV